MTQVVVSDILRHRIVTVVCGHPEPGRWKCCEVRADLVLEAITPHLGELVQARARRFVPESDPAGRVCFYCGRQLIDTKGWATLEAWRPWAVREHKIPLSRGGTDTPENVVWACRDCNQKKGSQTAEEFVSRGLRSLREWRKTFPCPTCGVGPNADCVHKTTYRRVGLWFIHQERGRQ